MRVKVHPIGYVPIKNKLRDLHKHFGESLLYVQTIRMANGQTRTIKHYQQLAIGGSRV